MPRNKEPVLRASRKYHARNKVRRNLENKAWRTAHKKERAEYMRRYMKEHPEVSKRYEARRKRPEGHMAKFNKWRRTWAASNPDKIQQYYHRRRAAKSINNTLTSGEIRAQREKQWGVCYFCKAPLDNGGNGHVDHLTPFCRGGFNEAKNIAITCSKCNLSKGKKTKHEFTSYRN